MVDAFNTLFTNRDHLRDRTRKLYRHNVERLMSTKFEPTDDLNMLSTHPEMVFEYVDECCDNTAKLCCTAVIALLKENQCENELLMPFVHKHRELAGKLKEKSDSQSTDKDFATLEEIKGVETLLTNVAKRHRLFTRAPESNAERDVLQRLLLMRLYLMYPSRNEFATLQITSCPSDAKYKGNWLCTRPYKIILNDYKTSNRYEHKEYLLPPSISRLAARVVKSSESGYLLNTPTNPANPVKVLTSITTSPTYLCRPLKLSTRKVIPSKVRFLNKIKCLLACFVCHHAH